MDASNTKNVRKGLTTSESRLLSSLSEKNKTVFGLEDITAELNCSYQYAKVLANNLARKKWIIVLRRGTYLIVPLSAGVKPNYTEHEFIIASHIASPYYIAYWSALNFHRFTEQTPLTVFVATTKRVNNREILSVRYNFVTLNKRKFFGFVPTAIGTHKINISNPEKTLADALDHPEYCGGIGEVAKSLWAAKERVSIDEVANCAKRMGNSAIIKRLGYLVETLEMPVDPKTLAKMRKAISQGMSVLDPTMPRKGRHTTRWNLLVNISKESVEMWRRDFDIA